MISSTDEELRTIKTLRSAVIRSIIIVAVGANRFRGADSDSDLSKER
jgi:hypothetical protein